MKTILILAHSPDMGGAELALKGLIDSLSDRFKITVVIPTDKQIDIKVKNNGISYIYLPLPWWCYEAHDAPQKVNKNDLKTNYDKLLNIAEEHDILLTNTITIPWLGFAATQLSKKHIWYIHEFGDIDHNLKFILGYKESLAIINKVSSRVLTISDAVVKHISQGIDKNKIDIIHQAIDLDGVTKIKPKTRSSELRLLCMGALKKSKGQYIAIGAVKLLNKKGYSVRLDIVGPSANNEYVEQLINASKNTNNINIAVRAYDIVKELKSHDILLMCSQNEALGRVTIEAMAASVPVIGYSSPATTYLLQNNKGLLYSNNTPENLSNALINFIVGNEDINLIEAKKFIVKTYTPSVQANDFITSINKAKSVTVLTNNTFNDYIGYLETNGILISKTSKSIAKYKSKAIQAIPSSVKKPVKKILKKGKFF